MWDKSRKIYSQEIACEEESYIKKDIFVQKHIFEPCAQLMSLILHKHEWGSTYKLGKSPGGSSY